MDDFRQAAAGHGLGLPAGEARNLDEFIRVRQGIETGGVVFLEFLGIIQ